LASTLPCPPPRVRHFGSSYTILPNPRGIAILAHPYAPFGGSSSDPVLALTTSVLLSSGFIVLTFDFRGAGRSGGKTSWTAAAEMQDYLGVMAFGVAYVRRLYVSLAGSGAAEGESSDCGWHDGGTEPLSIVLGGYSYGALVVQEACKGSFRPTAGGSASQTLLEEQAQTLADDHLKRSGQWQQPVVRQLWSPATSFSYLFISPLLQPLRAALTLQVWGLDPDKANPGRPLTLAVFGGQDGITSSRRLEDWARARKRYNPFLTSQVVEEAGHFWREPGVSGKLQEAIRKWLDEAPSALPRPVCCVRRWF